MPDDLHQSEEQFMQMLLSYRGIIPSKYFNEYEYSLYLEYASAGELEMDIVSEETYRKIISHDNLDYDEHLVDDKITMKYFR